MSEHAKAIVDGKRYDTARAEMVASWGNGLGYGDFGHLEEELWVTANGNYFLEGGGGPRSKYGVACGGGSLRGSSGVIRPLTDQEAYDWLELHDQVAAIEEHFSDWFEDA